MSVFDVLQERGFLKQMSHEEEIREHFSKRRKSLFISVLTRRQTACMSAILSP